MVIGVDIGGTKTAVMALSAEGEVIAQLSRPTAGASFVDGVIETIHVLLNETGTDDPLRGIGAGVPGMVNAESGEVNLAVNLNILTPTPLVVPLQETFGVPVALENDVRLGALGLQHLMGLDHFAYLAVGTGLAAGLILDGKLYRGRHGMAGELGHIQADDSGTILERLIAGPAIYERATAAGLSIKRATEVFELAADGDERAAAVVEFTMRYTARLIQWVKLAYDVEVIVLGGGVTAGRELYMAPLRAELAKLRAEAPFNDLMLQDETVRLVPEGINAGLWGGIQLAKQIQTLEQ